jgi:hypothetical protein
MTCAGLRRGGLLDGHANGVVDSALRIVYAGKNRINIVSADFFFPILSYRKIGHSAYRSFSNSTPISKKRKKIVSISTIIVSNS